jgi:SSS family solute:Na+ symporter
VDECFHRLICSPVHFFLCIGRGLALKPVDELFIKDLLQMLSFYLFVILAAGMAVVSLCERDAGRATISYAKNTSDGGGKLVTALWTALALVMIGLYIFFN